MGVSDSGSDTSATTTGGRHGKKKKKAGVNNKVNIPEFGVKMHILMMWPVPSGAGPGLLLITGIIMRMSIS